MSSHVWLRQYWAPTLMLIVLAPLSFPGSNGPGMMSGHNLLVWACVLLWVVTMMWCRHDNATAYSWLSVGVLTAVALMTLPMMWTVLPAWRLNALPRLVGMWGGAGLFILLLRVRFGFQGRAGFMLVLVVAGIIQALMALVQILFPLSSLVQHGLQYDVLAAQGRALGSFGQVNLLGSFLAVCASASLWCLLNLPSLRRGLLRGAACAALILIVASLIAARSRTGWLGGVLSCGGVLWLSSGSRPWRMLAGCLLLSGVLAVTVMHLQPQIKVNPTSSSGSAPGAETFNLDRMRGESRDRRLQMLQVAGELIRQHPLAGNGLGSFERRWSDGLTAIGDVSATPQRVIYPHNELLYVWCEGGIVALAGLMLAGLLWLSPVLRLFHQKRCSDRNVKKVRYSGLWSLTLPLALHTLTEFPFYLSSLHFVLFLLLWRLALPDGPVRSRIAGTGPIRYVVVPACIFGFVMLAAAGVNLYSLRNLEQSGFTHPLELVLPTVSTLLQAERLEFDRCVSLLMAFNHTHNPKLLRVFARQAAVYLSAHNDANLMDSLIRVDTALGHSNEAAAVLRRARVSFPDDPRFHSTGVQP